MQKIAAIRKTEWDDSYVRECRPCVIVDAAQDWPAFRDWSPQYLRSTCGDTLVTVQVSHEGRWRYDADGAATDPATQYGLPNVPFGKAVDWILDARGAGHKYYVSQSGMHQYPALAQDLRFPIPLDRSIVSLWFGSAGTVTPLHYDAQHNFFVQIYGTKTFTLFDPGETGHLYVRPRKARFPHISPVDIESPDLQAYPRFAQAASQTIELGPGQALFLPAFWWHHVRSREVSISVSQWWRPGLEEYRGMTAIRHLLHGYDCDGWCDFVASERLTVPRLLQLAEYYLRVEPALAVIAATVAMEDLIRRPTEVKRAWACDETVVAALRKLMMKLDEEPLTDADTGLVGNVIETLRRNAGEAVSAEEARRAPASLPM